MALAGNLRDFGVAEILQLIMTQEKTGVLALKSNSKVANIGFENGKLVEATYGDASRDRALKDYFTKSGRISSEELREIERHQAETNSSFEEVILKFGFVSEKELKELIVFRVQEVLDILLTWHEGDYRFDTEAVIYPKGVIQVAINPQALIMEGMRRIDEWPRIERILPDPNIILGKKPKPILSVEFGPEEKRVLKFIDGTRTLLQLQEVTGIGKFRTYQACFNLLEVGAIEKKGLAVRVIPKRKTISVEKVRGATFAGIGWVALAAFIGINLLLGTYIRNYVEKRTGERTSFYAKNIAVLNMNQLLDQYLLKHKQYPRSLGELVEEGWTSKAEASIFSYRLEEDGKTYVLTPLTSRLRPPKPLF
jgi:hypothetical protein